MTSYTGLGLMSGTSLDGLDVCCVEFAGDLSLDIWSYRVIEATTVPYSDAWRERLAGARHLSGVELVRLHYDYAHFMGHAVQTFLSELATQSASKKEPRLDFVATHGHTVFHDPDNRLTFQLGDGETLASYLKCPLVTNFRAKDVALGGQGAPLAPSAERFLYNNVGLCLNLGGIANVGIRGGKAWDICPCNSILNQLARWNDPDAEFDKDGELASKGTVQQELLQKLEKLAYYKQKPPKSLGAEWITDNIWPLLDRQKYSLADLACTYVEHVTLRIAVACTEKNHAPPTSPRQFGDSVVLITGGGAHNNFLMARLREKLLQQGIGLEETDPETVDFKEALIFAFLGLRCLLGKQNVFKDNTGATRDNVAGSVHQPAVVDPSSTGMYPNFRFLLRRQISSP